MRFSKRLRELRTEKNLTQKELASYLNLTPNSVCEWEKERCEPSIDTLKRLSVLFECSIDYLLGHSDDFGNVTVKQDGNAELTAEELEVLQCYRILPRAEQEQLKGYATFMADKWKK